MNEQVKRNPDGTFPQGVSGNPKGRPPKATEAAYARIEQEIITHEDYRLIVARQKADAQGRVFVIENNQPRILPQLDSDSTPADRARSASWIADRVRGKPVDYTRELADGDEAPAEQLPEYTAEQLGQIGEVIELFADIDPDQLAAIIAQAKARNAVQSDSGGTAIDSGGTAETGGA